MPDPGALGGSNGAALPVTRSLSPREAEILELLCRGLTAPQVAVQLGLSRGSVKNKRRAIYQKLHVSELAQACVISRKRAEPGANLSVRTSGGEDVSRQ